MNILCAAVCFDQTFIIGHMCKHTKFNLRVVGIQKNVFLVLSGHDPCANVVTTQTKGVHGNTVTQMLIDPQGVDNSIGATGMVAMLYFSNDGKTITVENYSTVKEQFFMTENQYTIDISDWVEGANGGDIGIIGGADGPDAILVSNAIIPFVIGAVAVFAIGGVVGFVFVKKKRG